MTDVLDIRSTMDVDSDAQSNAVHAPYPPLERIEFTQDQFHSSHVPSTDLASRVAQSLSKTEDLIGDLNDYIEGLQDFLEKKRAEVEDLEDYADRCASIISPIKRLPPEVLAVIFCLICYDADQPSASDLSLPGQLAALYLGRVCVHWHAVTVSTPAVWSAITLDFDRVRYTGREASTMHLLRLYLKRSKEAGLSVALVFARNDWQMPLPACLINLLLRHSNRWVDVHLFDVRRVHAYILSLWGTFKSLKSLYVRAAEKDCDLSFVAASSLQTVVLKGKPIAVPDDAAEPSFWRSSSNLDIDDYPIKDIATVLGAANPEAVTITCRRIHVYMPKISISSSLSSLTIQLWAHCDVLQLLFNALTLPALQKLEIHGVDRQTTFIFPEQQFLSFLARSKCEIAELKLRNAVLSDWAFASILGAMPTLKNLEFHRTKEYEPNQNPTITDTFLRRLTRFPISGKDYTSLQLPMLPKLSTLTLLSYPTTFDDDVLIDMLSSRLRAGDRHKSSDLAVLRMFKVHFSVDPDSLPRLRTLIETYSRKRAPAAADPKT